MSLRAKKRRRYLRRTARAAAQALNPRFAWPAWMDERMFTGVDYGALEEHIASQIAGLGKPHVMSVHDERIYSFPAYAAADAAATQKALDELVEKAAAWPIQLAPTPNLPDWGTPFWVPKPRPE